MDESHRLKPMAPNYDEQLFNQLFKDTKDLRRKLAFEIDARKFGVDYNEVLSWFDVKFIYTFNKYYGDPRLKGYIISSLQTLKLRIVKSSYQPKFELHNSFDITELYNYEALIVEEEDIDNEAKNLLVKAIDYIKARVSKDAYLIFELDLTPPPYILEKLAESSQKKIPKCPASIIAEYLGIGEDNLPEAINYIEELRKDVRDVVKRAQEHFQLI